MSILFITLVLSIVVGLWFMIGTLTLVEFLRHRYVLWQHERWLAARTAEADARMPKYDC